MTLFLVRFIRPTVYARSARGAIKRGNGVHQLVRETANPPNVLERSTCNVNR